MFQGRRTLMEQTGGSSAETVARYSGVPDASACSCAFSTRYGASRDPGAHSVAPDSRVSAPRLKAGSLQPGHVKGGCYFCRGCRRLSPALTNLPSSCAHTPSSKVRAALRTSSCSAESVSRSAWLVAQGFQYPIYRSSAAVGLAGERGVGH